MIATVPWGLVHAAMFSSLADIVDRFSTVRALVIGDAIIDQYHFGRIDRISPEAPVPVFVEDLSKVDTRRGGADNVAHQLEVLGCVVSKAYALRRSVKHRYMVGHCQVFRIDLDSSERCDANEFKTDKRPDVIVLSDYAKGFLTETLCRQVIELALEERIPVVVDPKGSDWSKYRGCTVLCPNESEYHKWNKEDQPDALLLKCGSKGMKFIDYAHGYDIDDCTEIPATARHVYDVTGAGDVVVALVAAALGVGCDLRRAAHIATHAAGYVVGEVGTAVCPKETLLRLIAEAVQRQ
jgi:D-beta-D-heptose 7-phosphate kinase/D-beta-D-heptose 1-phosphate adenosyltransferase